MIPSVVNFLQRCSLRFTWKHSNYNTMKTTLQVFSYKDNPVSFELGDGQMMINATQMARSFGYNKRPQFWLGNQSSKEFLAALSKARNLALADLVRVTKGGNLSGTWMHEDVALEFARWLSPEFCIWCNDRIKELIRFGMTITPEMLLRATENPQFVTEAINMLRDGYARSLVLQEENERLAVALESQIHKVEFYDNVHHAKKTLVKEKTIYLVSQIAAELGMSGAELNQILAAKGIQKRRGKIWLLTREYDGRGYSTKKRYQCGIDSEGGPLYCTFTAWTPKGREFILSLFE